MEKEMYIRWLNDLEYYWKLKDVESIAKLFSRNVKYYETPFEFLQDENNSGVELVWHDIDSHNINNLYYKVLGYRENFVIANFILELDDRLVDMVYEVELDSDNKCIFFKQWYMSNK